MNTKLFCWILLILIQIISFEATGSVSAQQTIPLGAVVSLSGFDSNAGQFARAGYELAAEEVNRTGGVFVKEYGKKIPLEIIVQDMESSAQKAVSRMEWLYTSKKVVAYVGTTFISAGSGVAEKNRIPALVIASAVQGIHERGFKYWFAPDSKTFDIARIIFDLLETIPAEKMPKTVAIFQEQTDFGLEQAEAFKNETIRRRYKVVVHEKYNPMTKDFSPLILAAKAAGAEMVLSSPVTPDGMAMMRQIKELDYNPKAIVVIRGAGDLPWGRALGPIGDYVIYTGGWHYRVNYPGVDKLNAAHQAKFGTPADMMTGPAYASVQILAVAIEKAGTLDPAKIRDALSATDMMTVVGRVKFRPNGTCIDPCPAIIQWQSGSHKLVWPKEFRETTFLYPTPAWKDR